MTYKKKPYKMRQPTCKYCHKDIIWRKYKAKSFLGHYWMPIDEDTGSRHICKGSAVSVGTAIHQSIEDKIAKAPMDAVSVCPDCNGVVPDCTGKCLNCDRVMITTK